MSRMLRIFVSSAQKEFAAERRAIRAYIEGDALLLRFFEVFLFEDLPASGRRADQVYLAEVDRCDVYLGLFGNDYGFQDKHGLSPTEREFDRATAAGKERLIFVKGSDDSARHPKMRALLHKAGDQLIRRRFNSAAELTTQVYASLVDYLAATGGLRTKPFDASACPGATLKDLSREKITDFLARAQAERAYPLGPKTQTAKALAHLNLLDGDHPTHAAVLLFGKQPQRFLITSEVKCLHFHGTQVQKPIPSYQVYKGTIFELVDQAVDFVMSKIGRSVGTRAEGPQAPVKYELPSPAVAEAIVNAIAHRDYASNASVQVMLFADRLEVWNPGHLPPSLTPESLRLPHASIPRNPLIAEPLFLARYIEKAGTGILDMISLCKAAGLPAPQFRQDGGQFIQTLRRPRGATTGQVTAQVTGQVPVPAAGQVAGQVTGQVAAHVLAQCQEPRTAKEIQSLIGIRHRETFLDNYLNPLLKNGWLRRTIPGKPTSRLQRYQTTAEGTKWLRHNATAAHQPAI